ncbi:MAG: hypothetical protein ACRDZ8_03075 [Acidimicrobiales bacterium]
MRRPKTTATLLTFAGLFLVAAGDVVFRLTMHDVQHGCGDVSDYSPAAPYLAIGAVALCVMALVHVASNWRPELSEARGWRAAAVAVSGLTLGVVGLSLIAMWGASTFEICF